MKHGMSHLVWMGVGFVALLVVGKLVGVSLILLFPLFCFFLMAAMMLGMNHKDSHHNHKEEK